MVYSTFTSRPCIPQNSPKRKTKPQSILVRNENPQKRIGRKDPNGHLKEKKKDGQRVGFKG